MFSSNTSFSVNGLVREQHCMNIAKFCLMCGHGEAMNRAPYLPSDTISIYSNNFAERCTDERLQCTGHAHICLDTLKASYSSKYSSHC